MTVEGATKVTHDGSVERVHVAVTLSQIAFEGLMGIAPDAGTRSAVRMENALRCYLGDRGADRPAWPYPGFLRAAETQADKQVELDVEEQLWRDFEAEASAQEVSVDQLAEHAAFYIAAEVDAGRITQRILEDLASGPDNEQN
jgi:hypothetical protein